MTYPTAVFAVVVVLVLQGCATAPQAPLDILPREVTGVLSSKFEHRSLSAAEQAEPTTSASIKRCEESGDQRCYARKEPGEQQTSFALGVDQQVIALFRSKGLSPGTSYTSACRVLDPANKVVVLVRNKPFEVPSNVAPEATMRTFCEVALRPDMPPGQWVIEFFVNDRLMTYLRFDVRAASNPVEGTVKTEPRT